MMLILEFMAYGYILSDDGRRIPMTLCLADIREDPDWMQAAIDLMRRHDVLRITNMRFIGIANYYN